MSYPTSNCLFCFDNNETKKLEKDFCSCPHFPRQNVKTTSIKINFSEKPTAMLWYIKYGAKKKDTKSCATLLWGY